MKTPKRDRLCGAGPRFLPVWSEGKSIAGLIPIFDKVRAQ